MRFLIQTLFYALLLTCAVWYMAAPAEFTRFLRSLM